LNKNLLIQIHYEICALLGYSVASSGNSLPTFRDNLSGPETREGITTTRCVITHKTAVVMYFAAEAWNHQNSLCTTRESVYQLCHRRSVVYRTGLHLIKFTCPCLQVPRLGPRTIKSRNIKDWSGFEPS